MNRKIWRKRRNNFTREVIESKLEEARERLKRYESYQKLMEETGASQLSLTDADARLMKDKDGFSVSYNPQTAVDSETHIIRDFNMMNQVTDHGQLMPTMEWIREESTDGVIDGVADKGYEQPEDMIECLENGIIPHVITDDGKDGYDLEIPYVESPDADVTSTDPEELKKCLQAGKIPDAYADVVTKAEVKEVRRMVKDDEAGAEEEPKSIYGTPEEMQERAKEGYFVRDPERNLVYCPGGEILRQKTAQRMCLSEHPFGIMKRAMRSDYFLLKGMRKVTGEFAPFCLGYNLIRAKNLLGFDKMMELMAG